LHTESVGQIEEQAMGHLHADGTIPMGQPAFIFEFTFE
jgi:hypothetical protein